jgi:hypothetical protein
MRPLILMPSLVGLVACMPDAPTTTTLRGSVFESADADSFALGQVDITVMDPKGQTFDAAVSKADGTFEVTAPLGKRFAVVMSADGYATTSITGYGVNDVVVAADRDLFLRSDDWINELRQSYEGCPGADGDSALVEGILRVHLPVPSEEVDTLPVVKTASMTLAQADSDTEQTEPCYLDDEGLAWAPDASVNGDSGQFAFFDAPVGWATLGSTYTVEDIEVDGMDHPVWVPEGGVASLDPAFVASLE